MHRLQREAEAARKAAAASAEDKQRLEYEMASLKVCAYQHKHPEATPLAGTDSTCCLTQPHHPSVHGPNHFEGVSKSSVLDRADLMITMMCYHTRYHMC